MVLSNLSYPMRGYVSFVSPPPFAGGSFVRGKRVVDFALFLSDRLGAPFGTSGGRGTLLLEEEVIRGVECDN
jgi:hypothetical protein